MSKNRVVSEDFLNAVAILLEALDEMDNLTDKVMTYRNIVFDELCEKVDAIKRRGEWKSQRE